MNVEGDSIRLGRRPSVQKVSDNYRGPQVDVSRRFDKIPLYYSVDCVIVFQCWLQVTWAGSSLGGDSNQVWTRLVRKHQVPRIYYCRILHCMPSNKTFSGLSLFPTAEVYTIIHDDNERQILVHITQHIYISV